MKWEDLLNSIRALKNDNKEQVRSPFLRDVDKITFSSYFRKLQDKTQVHPLSKSSYVRTRLTHSLETATVGRSLGYMVGEYLKQENFLPDDITSYDIGYIVQAACLAHDIGNPPFGHQGEAIIGNFYAEFFDKTLIKTGLDNTLTPHQVNNFLNFDGNAQGFRIITNIAGHSKRKGLGLTYPVLAAFCKYPSTCINKDYIGSKKIGIFNSEEKLFKEIVNSLKLTPLNKEETIYARHPLSFLVEAADDICYSIADIEDGFSVGLLSFKEVRSLLLNIVDEACSTNFNLQYSSDEKPLNLTEIPSKLKTIKGEHSKIEFLSSNVINILIHAVTTIFINNHQQILSGEFNEELLCKTIFKDKILEIKQVAKEKIFNSNSKKTHELVGISAIYGVLEELTNIIFYPTNTKSKMLNNIFLNSAIKPELHLYEKLLIINDFIVNCTDQNIIDNFKHMKGILN